MSKGTSLRGMTAIEKRLHKRAQQRKWKALNPDKMAAYRRAYRERHYVRKPREPLKRYAKDVVRRLTASGGLERGPCVVCGIPDGHEHHPDYERPDEVVWLCNAHHKEVHMLVIDELI